jgi:uncharacterized phiE125 gp8 family phage protein
MITSALHRQFTGEDAAITVDRNRFRYSLTTPPTSEPVTLEEAKHFARIDPSGDAPTDVEIDALVTSLIVSARQNVEGQTGRSFIDQTRTATLDFLPNANEYELAFRPISSVTSIKAYNDDGTFEGLDVGTDIIVDQANARIALKADAASITGDRQMNVFEIVYVAGYGDEAADVPEWAKTAIKMLVSTWYENRESVAVGTTANKIPLNVQLIIDQNCVVEL